MRLRSSSALLFSFLLGMASASAQENVVALEPAFPGMSFSLPVTVAPLPGSKDVVFIVEKGDPVVAPSADKKKAKGGDFHGGKVQMISGLSSGHPVKTEVFQLSPKDGKFDAAGECGFLGFAVHPNYKENKQVFAYYSLRIGGKLHQRVSRFLLSSVEPFKVDPQSEQPFITQLDPAGNHNGGDIHFGPDGYLYISCGDGGAATAASLKNSWQTDVDARGNLYIADTGNHRVRKLDLGSGQISTVAGDGTPQFAGDALPGAIVEQL